MGVGGLLLGSVEVGSVNFQQDDSQGNPVLAYLQRHGASLGITTPLANEGYDVDFVGMVLPGDPPEVKLRHIGMWDGNLAVSIETTNGRGEELPLENVKELGPNNMNSKVMTPEPSCRMK
ncbi:hypothetical protein GALMADRAFT_214951 [Galerina marginata CBS 339.88]|uniref:Uncharacterized protein n=1 Tax=Galerina marginata (strain CBS 339.88) TaxID=685588 RepID=A0A067SG68_GALM3|nr:hypothetical protein GALMADRAFT_214951 [Galerina marginata CBS 339.88]